MAQFSYTIRIITVDNGEDRSALKHMQCAAVFNFRKGTWQLPQWTKTAAITTTLT